MHNIAIDVRDVSITYQTLRRISLRRGARDMRARQDFTAVRDVSFQVETGQIMGIIGRNGSGKSTLLRAIAGIFSPDSGSIDTFGKTVSLLALGVGFQTNLSGRENICLSGMLLGFSHKQVHARMDEIIAFSGLDDFIERPVRTYSSGMQSKLAFSITAVMEPEIMLIDEILSVGDASFQKRSYRKMKELIADRERTVVIISHSMASILDLCTSALWLHDGQVRAHGDVQRVIDAYEATVEG